MRQTKRNKRFQYVTSAFRSFAEQNAEQDKSIKSRLQNENVMKDFVATSYMVANNWQNSLSLS